MSASKLYLKRDYNTGVFPVNTIFKNTYFVVDLWMAGSETPILGSLFNKVASMTAWTHLAVLERTPSKGIYMWILWNLKEAFLQNTCYQPLLTWCCFFSFCKSVRFVAFSVYLVEQWWTERRNLQVCSVLCSYGNQVETALSSYGHTCTEFAIESRRKGRTEKFVKVR